VLAVPAANKQTYIDHATKVSPVFKEFGVTRMVETWGDDVPDGKVTDFKAAVKAKDDEVVLFSWVEWPSKEVRDAGSKKMMEDARIRNMRDMPFDAKRMIFGGFASILDNGKGGATGYVDGFVVPVLTGDKQAYLDMAKFSAPIFREHGATRGVETWGDDVPDCKVTDFKNAVKAVDGETIVYSWIEWPSKEVRDAGMKAFMQDQRIKDNSEPMPFDGKRMIFGGFAPVLDR